MARYIDADAVIKSLWASLRGYRHVPEICAVKGCILEIEETPTADVQEVKHGEWIAVYYNGKLTGGKCSVCGKYKRAYNMANLRNNYKFCHGCGAKMDGEKNAP